MSGMTGGESQLPQNIAFPTEQEASLLALLEGRHEVVADMVLNGLADGRSPSFLAVARPDLAINFAKVAGPVLAANTLDIPEPSSDTLHYKRPFFDALAARAGEGDMRALAALPKFAVSLGQVAATVELMLDFEDTLVAQTGDRRFLQYLGTFDPQHVGHRIAVASALGVDGPDAHGLVHVMGDHPFKQNISQPYDERYRTSEERLYRSSLLDNTRVTQVDVPGALGLGKRGQEQMALLADVTGDEQLRWLIGSDKFLLDTRKVQSGDSPQKAVARFTNSRTHMYVVHRQSDQLDELEGAVDYVTDQFGTDVTLVPELPYDCAPASSSRIKELRRFGEDAAADHMELYELES